MLGEVDGQRHGGLDLPKLGAGGVDGVLGVGHLPSNAVLLAAEQVQRYRAFEVCSEKSHSFVFQPFEPLLRRRQEVSASFVLLREVLDEHDAELGEFLAGCFDVDPCVFDELLDQLGSDVAHIAGHAVLLALATEVVVGTASSLVA